MKKNMLTFIMMLIIMVLAACSTNSGDTNDDSKPDQNEDPIIEENIGNNELDEGLEESGNNGSEHADENLISEMGIYNGQADPHTIEIETTTGPLAFQLTMEARDDVESLIEGKEVTYTYSEDGDVRTIESIQMNE